MGAFVTKLDSSGLLNLKSLWLIQKQGTSKNTHAIVNPSDLCFSQTRVFMSYVYSMSHDEGKGCANVTPSDWLMLYEHGSSQQASFECKVSFFFGMHTWAAGLIMLLTVSARTWPILLSAVCAFSAVVWLFHSFISLSPPDIYRCRSITFAWRKNHISSTVKLLWCSLADDTSTDTKMNRLPEMLLQVTDHAP